MGFGHRNISIIVMVGVFGFLLGSFGIISSNTDNSLQTDSVMAVGHLQLVLKDADGSIKQYVQTDNLIVDQGFNTMADLIFDSDLAVDGPNNHFNVIALGNSSSPEDSGDTRLVESHVNCANSTAIVGGSPTSGGSPVFVFFDITFNGTDGCVGTFQEAVLGNDVSGGEILSRQTFPAIIMAANDVLDIFWDISLGGAVEVGGP